MSRAERGNGFTQVEMLDKPQVQIVNEAVGTTSQGQGNSIRLLVSQSRKHSLAGCH